ncbi:pilus assembly protein PilP [Polyangium aurulentum]|uniref:pilus assembly protein PilP n=1 Tax=Polyangium aurulentum TaxID=2567896 RepID=UPI0010AEB315|nr:pilus assembly protein PilP [Polyangium aurulentum]UQA63324.1 pilus assembly protein PilP [Polyangium aurulentum]
MKRPWRARAFVLLVASAIAAGCEDDETWTPPPAPNAPAQPAAGGEPAGAAAAPPSARGDAGAALPTNLPDIPERQFTEADFSETDRNRDPFRGFASLFAQQAKGRSVQQRQVLVDRYSLDELKLVGVVTRGPARALFTDPTGLGWVLKVGDYVGKPEIVHTGGPSGADVAINWRVDRIRESDVVFVREDPAHPEIAPVTRVVALFPTDDKSSPR